jgi:hypothetical protein
MIDWNWKTSRVRSSNEDRSRKATTKDSKFAPENVSIYTVQPLVIGLFIRLNTTLFSTHTAAATAAAAAATAATTTSSALSGKERQIVVTVIQIISRGDIMSQNSTELVSILTTDYRY